MIFEAKITSRKNIAAKTWEVTLSHDNDTFYFNAGQYVWLVTPVGRKAFSISSSSKDPKNIQIIFRENSNDAYKKYLLDEKNQAVTIRGAFGTMRVPKKGENTMYITGGVGIAPVLSIVRSLSENKKNIKLGLVFTNHSKETEFYIDELGNIPNLNFKHFTGEINPGDLQIEKTSKYYVLGPQKFVDSVYSNLILNGVEIDNIFFEENYPSVLPLSLENDDFSYFKIAVDQSINHIVITDANGVICYANKAAEATTGFTFEEMAGQTPRLWGGLEDAERYRNFWKTIKTDKISFKGEFKNQRKNGEEYYVSAVVSPILDKDREVLGFLGMEEDITENKKNEMIYKQLNNLMVDRELKMIELKKQIQVLGNQTTETKGGGEV